MSEIYFVLTVDATWILTVCFSSAILGPVGQSFQNWNEGIQLSFDVLSFDTAQDVIDSSQTTSFIWYVMRSSENNILGT